MSRSDVLLVVNSGDRAYRGYCLERVAAAYPVVLINPSSLTWQRPLVDDHVIADPTNPLALRAAARLLAERHTITGVLTWDEYLLGPVAALAAELGLPGNTPSAVRACRDKAATRRLLDQASVPSAASTPVHSLTEAATAATRTGYPVVLKPVAQAGSIGVIRVDHPADLPGGYAFAATHAGGQGREGSSVLVEEYLDGPEISVECVVDDGTVTAVAVTRKTLGLAPYFQETGHTVTASDPLLSKAAPLAARALTSLGVSCGLAHVEIRLTAAGPRIVEVNARLAGDMIGQLVLLATGIDLPRAAADLARGHTPDLTPDTEASAAIKILYPPRSGTLTDRHLDLTTSRPSWLHHVHWQREIGDRVALPPHGDFTTARCGYLITTGTHPNQTHQRLTALTDQLTLTVTPDTVTPDAA